MERNQSIAAKQRCHEKLVWDRQTLAVMSRALDKSFLFPSVTQIKKKTLSLLAPRLTPATLFTTPAKEPKEILNPPNQDVHKGSIFEAGEISRPPKLESSIHSPDACLHQTQKPELKKTLTRKQ